MNSRQGPRIKAICRPAWGKLNTVITATAIGLGHIPKNVVPRSTREHRGAGAIHNPGSDINDVVASSKVILACLARATSQR